MRFNPHPGSLPGGTTSRRARRSADVSTLTRDHSRVELVERDDPVEPRIPVSTLTRDHSRVEHERGRGARLHALPRFNPHPGSLPGGTTVTDLGITFSSKFQPSPGITPGWNNLAESQMLKMRNRWFQPSPGITPGWNWGLEAFQPSPGITPGWNQLLRAFSLDQSFTFQPSPGITPRWNT